ncbi:copper chaperone PCu(A)C [Streptomyces sp. NPDC047706]|uniref:copper chaperone PCu(A)C n=1 Tax=Streptomyces sp. NPDC047706 TaxID=3365486 RepID=UPI003710535A
MNVKKVSGPWRRAVTFLVVGCLAAVWGTTGCASDNEYNPPGANARVGQVLIRFAHLAEPPDGPWEQGDDVPLYAWFFNEGQEADRLVGAETTVASSVDIVNAGGTVRGPVELPPRQLVELEEGRTHLLLKDVRQRIRGGEFVWITLRFERAGEIALQVHSQAPTYDDDDVTHVPGLTSPSPE